VIRIAYSEGPGSRKNLRAVLVLSRSQSYACDSAFCDDNLPEPDYMVSFVRKWRRHAKKLGLGFELEPAVQRFLAEYCQFTLAH
jgi:hypothetical protein